MIILIIVCGLFFIDAVRTERNIRLTPAAPFSHHYLSERLYGDLIALVVMAFLIGAAAFLPL